MQKEKLPVGYAQSFLNEAYMHYFFSAVLIAAGIALPTVAYLSFLNNNSFPISLLILNATLELVLISFGLILLVLARKLQKDSNELQAKVIRGIIERRGPIKHGYQYSIAMKNTNVPVYHRFNCTNREWNFYLERLPLEVELWQGLHSGKLLRIILPESKDVLDILDKHQK